MLIILYHFLPLIINHRTSFFLTSNADITFNLSNPTVEMDPCKHEGIFLMIRLITFSKEYFASICFFAQYEQPRNVSPKHQRSPASCLQQQSTADVQEFQYLRSIPPRTTQSIVPPAMPYSTGSFSDRCRAFILVWG